MIDNIQQGQDPEDTSVLDSVLNFLFGNPNVQADQALIPNPRNILPALGKVGRKAGEKLVQGARQIKGVPSPQPAAEAAQAGQAAPSVLSSLGKLGIGAAATSALGFIPGSKQALSDIITLGRAAADTSTPMEITETPSSFKQPSVRPDIVSEILGRGGVVDASVSPAQLEAEALQGYEDRRQALAQTVGLQSAGVESIKGLSSEMGQARRDILSELANLQAAPVEDPFTSQIVSLLGVGLPSALAGSKSGVDQAIATSTQLAQQAKISQATREGKIRDLKDRAYNMLKDQIATTEKEGVQVGRVQSALKDEAAAFDKVVNEERKARAEGRLDKAVTRSVGDAIYRSTGQSMRGEKLYRKEGAPKLNTETQKRIDSIVNVSDIMEQDLLTLQRIVNEVGATGAVELSEPVTIIDPKTGKERSFKNAAAAMQTLSGKFLLRLKDMENLGALGQDVIDLFNRIITDPTGYMSALKDINSGTASAISQNIDILVTGYRNEKEELLANNGILRASDINLEKLKLGEYENFSMLPENKRLKDHPDRSIKMVDPNDGKVFLITPEEFNEVINNQGQGR